MGINYKPNNQVRILWKSEDFRNNPKTNENMNISAVFIMRHSELFFNCIGEAEIEVADQKINGCI